MDRFAEWLLVHRRTVIGFVLALSAVLGVAAAGVRLEFRARDLLPIEHPFVRIHERYHRNFSEANVLTVMVEARDGTIFTVPTLAAIFRITAAVDRLPGVNHDQVTSIAHGLTRWVRAGANGRLDSGPIMLREPQTDADVDEVRRNVRAASYVLGSMLSLDQRAAVIRAGFIEQRLDYRALFEAVNRTVLPLANEHVAVYVSGQPRLNGWILDLQTQVLYAFAIAIVITWLCLYAYFRDWRGALRPTISGGLAALWGFGLMRLTGFALNPLLLVIPFLITARAVSHSAQMHDRYYEELGAGAVRGSAIRASFVQLVAPTAAGILTDALGVLAIGIVAIPALRQLAVSASLWILSLMITELMLNPIVYAALRAPDAAVVHRREHGWLAQMSAWLGGATTGRRGRWVTLAATGILVAAAAAVLPRLQIGDPSSASRVLRTDSEFNRSHHAVQDEFGGSEPFVVIAEGDGPDTLQTEGVLRTIESFQRALERNPVVGASFSLVDIQLAIAERFHESEPKWGVIPADARQLRETFFIYWGGVPPSTSARFFTPDFSAAHITFFCHDHAIDHVRRLVADAEAFIAGHPLPHVRFRLAAGFIGIMAAVYDEILRSDVLMTTTSFAVILVVCALTYRSLLLAGLVVLPLVLANMVVNAYMAARGLGLDLDTLPIIAVGVGFGIDYGIYVLSRVLEGISAGATVEEATRLAVARSGRTVVFTALTMTAGILCFVATDLRFVGEMATLLALWMVASCATAVTVLPAMLVVIRPRALGWQRNRRATPPSEALNRRSRWRAWARRDGVVDAPADARPRHGA